MFGMKLPAGGTTKTEAEKPFWISYADLMTALMCLFLVTMVTSLILVTQQIEEATRGEKNRAAEILDLCDRLRKEAGLINAAIKVECKDNRINFGEAGRFDSGDFKLKDTGERALRDVVPLVLSAAESDIGKKWFKQVLIEGFTDTNGSYLYNLDLSLKRSYWVMCTLLSDQSPISSEIDRASKIMIKRLFLAGGVAFNNPSIAGLDASRRVELRLQFYGLKESKSESAVLLRKFEETADDRCRL